MISSSAFRRKKKVHKGQDGNTRTDLLIQRDRLIGQEWLCTWQGRLYSVPGYPVLQDAWISRHVKGWYGRESAAELEDVNFYFFSKVQGVALTV